MSVNGNLPPDKALVDADESAAVQTDAASDPPTDSVETPMVDQSPSSKAERTPLRFSKPARALTSSPPSEPEGAAETRALTTTAPKSVQASPKASFTPPRNPPPPTVTSADALQPDDGHELQMGLFDHLNELRIRLFRAALALVLATLISFLFASNVLEYFKQPYPEKFIALGPTDAVVAYFRVALLCGAILSIPLTTYQLLAFIFPGLTRKEKSIIRRSIPAVTGLFLVGAAFAWFLLIPPAVNFLDSFQSELFQSQWTADRYLGFVTALIFWMGVAFETPLIFFVLALLGQISARPLIKNWRVAIVGAAAAAAFITPTVDPVNMFLVMAPLLVLYVISIFLVIVGRRISKVDA